MVTIGAAALAWAVLVCGATVSARGGVEADLTARATQRTTDLGLTQAQVAVRGLDVQVRLADGSPALDADTHAALDAALDEALPWVARVDLPPAPAAEASVEVPDPLGILTLEPVVLAAPPSPGEAAVVVSGVGRQVVVEGSLPDEVTLDAVRKEVRDYRRIRKDGLTVSGTTTAGGMLDGLRAGMAVFSRLTEPKLTVTARRLTVEGGVADAASSLQLLEKIRKNLRPGYTATVSLHLTGPVPREKLGVRLERTSTEVRLLGVSGSPEARARLQAAVRRAWPGVPLTDAIVTTQVEPPQADTAGTAPVVFEPCDALTVATLALTRQVPLTVEATGTGQVALVDVGAPAPDAATLALLEGQLAAGSALIQPNGG